MQWYYSYGEVSVGPVNELDFRKMLSDGVINANTLVWNRNMPEWQFCDEYLLAHESGYVCCSECMRVRTLSNVIEYKKKVICQDCKEAYFQSVIEGGEDCVAVDANSLNKNTIATIGMSLGFASLLFVFVPILSLLCGVYGMVVSFIGRKEARRINGSKASSHIGIAVSTFTLVIFLIVFVEQMLGRSY